MYNFLYTADSNYFNQMYLSIYSLLKNNTYPLTIHIIEADFSKEQIEKLEKLFSLYDNATLKIYSINKLKFLMDKYSIPKWRGTDIANARLFSHETIDVDKILYIDSDTIISSSLKDLFYTNVGKPISAVREIIIPHHLLNRLNSYYNSGVLLIDYKLCEEIDFLRQIFDTLNTTDIPLLYPDQDLLNLTLSEQIGTLSPNYNLNPMVYDMLYKHPLISKKHLLEKEKSFYCLEELMNAYKNPIIYHLLSYVRTRPWIKNSVHPFNLVYDLYSIEAFGKIDKVENNNKIDSLISSIPIFILVSVLLEILSNDQIDVKGKIKQIFKRK